MVIIWIHGSTVFEGVSIKKPYQKWKCASPGAAHILADWRAHELRCRKYDVEIRRPEVAPRMGKPHYKN